MKIMLCHWGFLLETLFLPSLGRDELQAAHWSSSCSASSHVVCAPQRITLFFTTCFTPCWLPSRRLSWGPGECWLWGNPMVKGSVEIQSYRGTKLNCLITESDSERNKNFALSLSFWLFQVVSVHFSALLLEDEKKVLPEDKTNLLWGKKYT